MSCSITCDQRTVVLQCLERKMAVARYLPTPGVCITDVDGLSNYRQMQLLSELGYLLTLC